MASHATTHLVRVREIGRASNAPSPWLAGVSFLAVGVAFLFATMLGASMAPGYDAHGGAISDLGVIGDSALLFNGMLIAIGAMNALGGYVFFRSHGRRWLLAVSVLAGIGAAGAGLFPLTTGGLHSIFALVAFVFFNVEALATALVVAGPLRAISLLAGFVGLAYVAVMVIGDGGNPAIFGAIGHGGAERMIAYPPMVWLIALGGWLIARPHEDALRR
jgi:hypothetical membrane protein